MELRCERGLEYHALLLQYQAQPVFLKKKILILVLNFIDAIPN